MDTHTLATIAREYFRTARCCDARQHAKPQVNEMPQYDGTDVLIRQQTVVQCIVIHRQCGIRTQIVVDLAERDLTRLPQIGVVKQVTNRQSIDINAQHATPKRMLGMPLELGQNLRRLRTHLISHLIADEGELLDPETACEQDDLLIFRT